MRMQSYRALVEDPERQIRGLLQQVGLDWQQSCLTPENGGSLVRTASVLQVREKINVKGLGKWHAYEEQLSPLLKALGGPDWLESWQELDKTVHGTVCPSSNEEAGIMSRPCSF